MRTTKALLELGIPKYTISTVECDPLIYDIHVKSGINSYNMYLEEFVSKPPQTGYQVLCFDICGMVSTLEPCVMLALKNKMITNNTILATTVCKRSKGGKFDKNFEDFYQRIVKYAAKYRLKIDSRHKYDYSGKRENGRRQSAMHSEFFIFKKF